jgi:hypothetical protein
MKLTQEQLEDIRQRAENATPGPWKWVGQTEGGFIPQGAYLGDTLILLGDHYENYKEDATFIAHARTDIPLLLDHIAELEAEVKRLESELTECNRVYLELLLRYGSAKEDDQ